MILNFHPDLRDYFPETVKVTASTPLDALSLIATQHPMNGKIRPIPVKFVELQTYGELNDQTLQDKQFTVVPAHEDLKKDYVGAGTGKKGGLIQVIVGVVLIIVGIVFYAFGGQFAIQLGLMLVVTGLMAMLAPQVSESEQLNRKSRVFSGNKTTSEIGTPIQMIFGECRAYAHLLSFNLQARDYDGIDRPDESPYFKGKADESLPTLNLNKFYGMVRAGDVTKLIQLDADTNRTGTEIQ